MPTTLSNEAQHKGTRGGGVTQDVTGFLHTSDSALVARTQIRGVNGGFCGSSPVRDCWRSHSVFVESRTVDLSMIGNDASLHCQYALEATWRFLPTRCSPVVYALLTGSYLPPVSMVRFVSSPAICVSTTAHDSASPCECICSNQPQVSHWADTIIIIITTTTTTTTMSQHSTVEHGPSNPLATACQLSNPYFFIKNLSLLSSSAVHLPLFTLSSSGFRIFRHRCATYSKRHTRKHHVR